MPLTLLERYYCCDTLPDLTSGERAVFEIVDAIADCEGLGDAWIDLDRDAREAILQRWLRIIEDGFAA